MQDKSKTALVLIDIQNFYFPGGKWELENPEAAANNAQIILNNFREKGMLVVHIRHNSEPGGEIHSSVLPIEGEKIITKNEVNSFNGTDLKQYLDENGIKKLVICGMMTHMCVEAATRAAYDLKYEVTLIEDACATKSQQYNATTISANAVHCSVLSTLSGTYAKVTETKSFVKNFE